MKNVVCPLLPVKKIGFAPIYLILVVIALLLGVVTAQAATDVYTASTTWTAPAGVTSVDVEVWGGGGAGGGQNQSSDGGGGGGGGAYSKVLGIVVTPGNTYTVTVGAGGVGVASGTGGSGGDSYFINITTVLAKGGVGGAPSTGTPPAGGAGGAAASSVGTTKFSGGNGGKGRDNNNGQGGPGGSSAGTAANGTSGPDPWSTLTAAAAPAGGGIGGNGGGANVNGFAPSSGNGGGGGGSGEGNSMTGGGGAAGKVILTYVAAPMVTTNAATVLTPSGATLNGTVSSNGAITTVTFDYGTTIAYGSTATATASPLAATAVNTAVSVAVTGLTCNTTYHFRVKGVNSAGTTNGSDLTFTTSACPPLATCNSGTISGVINTYYPGAASVAAGATSISVGAASGAATGLAQNDLILVMQMQDATIDTTNASSYGTATFINAGKYEYATVASVAGSIVTLTSGLVNSYTTAAYGAAGQKTFQVIRVPVYSSATLGAATAKAWDGSSGGVLAFDVTGALTLAGATADVSGKGFRGGATRTLAGGAGADTDYRTAATVNNNGSKGEGIAGTPRYVLTAPGTVTNTGVEGYVSGSHARGSPANAGGGGTDGNPVNNDQNTGGGGGGNGGTGGMGGIAWCPGFSASSPPNYNCDASGGLGGKTVAELAPGQITMGGGGGGATSNNGTGSGACDTTNGACASGATGGGIILVRAATLSGSATFSANGSNADNTVGNDGSGGGAAAGAVLLYAGSHAGGNITLNVNGGSGGTNLIPPFSSGPHGPGGGGGGGYAVRSAAVSVAACNRNGGTHGDTYNNGIFFGAYGATDGSLGQCVSSLTSSQMPGAALGAGPCVSALHHYAISYPLGNPGVTCEALAVRVTGHDTAHVAVAPIAGTQITLSTSPAADGWALRSGGGTFTAPNKYTFDGTETYAEFWLTKATPTTAPHIDIDVTDGSKTDADGDATEDEKAQFADTAFKYYDGPPPGGAEVSINNQIAGKSSNTAPNAQSLYLRAVKKDTTTGACVGGLAGAQNVEFAYECNTPTTCYGANLMSVNGGVNTIIARNNNGAVSGTGGSYTPVGMTFDASGYAPFNLNYNDAGQVTLHARKTVTAGVGTPPSTAATIYGASNAFVVRPFAFDVTAYHTTPGDNPGATASGGTVFTSAGSNFNAVLRSVVWQAADDVDNNGLPDVGAILSDNSTTYSYAWATGLSADSTAGSYTPAAGVLGTLSPSPANLTQASFSNGQATYTPLTYSEVGSFTLLGTATDYLGVIGLNVTGKVVVGRFIPHHFDTVVTGGMACPTATGLTCPTLIVANDQGFVYSGQPFTTNVIARNLGGATTLNYDGSLGFAKAVTLGAWDALGSTATQNPPAATPGALAGNAAAATAFTSGATTTGTPAMPAYTLPNAYPSVTPPPGPTDIYLRAVESAGGDGVTSLRGVPANSVEGGIKIVSGRVMVPNAYGSELLRLPVNNVTVQYYNGTRWVTSSTDTTPLVPGNVTIANCTKNLGNPAPACKAPPVVEVASVALVNGVGSITLRAPGSGNNGSADLTLNSAGWPIWLPSSTGRAAFGIYKSRFIYLREMY